MLSEDNLDRVFKALANPVRWRICDELKLRPLTTSQLCACFPQIDRCTVMQHLGNLERAGLVMPVAHAPEVFYHLDARSIETVYARWCGSHAAGAPSDLSPSWRVLEGAPSDRPSLAAD